MYSKSFFLEDKMIDKREPIRGGIITELCFNFFIYCSHRNNKEKFLFFYKFNYFYLIRRSAAFISIRNETI